MGTEPFLLTGGCHCRALRYTVTQAPLGAYVCHCTDCQSLSGSAFAIGVVVPDTAFSLNRIASSWSGVFWAVAQPATGGSVPRAVSGFAAARSWMRSYPVKSGSCAANV